MSDGRARPEAERGPREQRDEPTYKRVDRNLTELVSELRVALPGVQVLFGFLLVVPFNQRFSMADGLVRGTYVVTLVLTAASCICLIAPSFHHRFQFRRQLKEQVVLIGNGLAVTGMVLLALAMVGVVLLVTAFLFGHTAAYATAAVVAVIFGVLWFAIPLRRMTR